MASLHSSRGKESEKDLNVSPQKLQNLLRKTEKAFQSERKMVISQSDSDEWDQEFPISPSKLIQVLDDVEKRFSSKSKHTCEICHKGFSKKFNLQRHSLIHDKAGPSTTTILAGPSTTAGPSTIVPRSSTSKADPSNAIAGPSMFNATSLTGGISCDICKQSFTRMDSMKRHRLTHLQKENLHQPSTSSSNICEICGKSFSRPDALRRHLHSHAERNVKFTCGICGSSFTRSDNLKQHLRSHENPQYSCRDCDQKFSTKFNLNHHVRLQHNNSNSNFISVKKQRNDKAEKFPPRKQTNALNVFRTVYIEPEDETKFDINVFYHSVHDELKNLIEEAVEEQNAIKWHLLLKVSLEKVSAEGEEEVIIRYFHSDTISEFTIDNIEEHLDEAHSKILKSFDKFIQQGSGWRLRDIIYFELKLAKQDPLRGNSYVKLPKVIQDTKSVLNIENFDDEKCFLWCVLAHKLNLSIDEHPERVSKYHPFENQLKMDGIAYPVPYQKVKQIEEKNNLRINVYGFDSGEISILHVSDQTHHEVINLLLISNGEKSHYTLIRDFSRFMAHRTNHNGVQYYCFRCLHGFSREDLLEEHIHYCKKQAVQIITMPKEGENILRFTGTHYQHPIAYTIYADFEALIVPIDTSRPSNSSSYQINTAQHVPCGYSFIIVGSDGRKYRPMTVYRGEDAIDNFLEEILNVRKELAKKLNYIAPMNLSSDEERRFQEATHCSICHKVLRSKRVRDHDHITSKFRGAAHTYCNLNFKQAKIIPVVFHNLKHYDAHHIMTKLGKFKEYKIDVIAATLEQYITFKIKRENCNVQLAFIDSLQFLPASLDKLVSNLQPSDFKLLKDVFPLHTELLTRKGIYPYEYFDRMEKFDEKQLPPKSAFFSDLTGEDISQAEYEHAQLVWNTFHLKTLGEYHNLYVMTDVLLLADIFQNFRDLCLLFYNIDAAHLVTSPGLSWQACLKMTEVELELFTDTNMLLFIEHGVRGGVSQISHRFATANNKDVPNYNEDEDKSHIMYWDANNLYGWAMSQYMPHGGFCWANPKDFDTEKITSISEEANIGFIFEVDLKYPESLHDLHNDYPLAPERMMVTEDMLSPYARSLLKKGFRGTPKLIPNLQDKKNYVCHYRNLQLYISLGLEIQEIHKVLQFHQSPWLKSYIEFNTEKRKMAKTGFERDFFKLLNNSIYGKCIENLRKRRNIELCNDERRAMKLTSSPNFKYFKEFDENLVAVERQKPSILMNRPIYVGFCILELSKVLMYDFHYNFIKKTYPEDRAILLFTDTDSLTYYIKTDDLLNDMKNNSSKFDFSDYPKNHPLYSDTNKKVLGKFKDELNGEAAYQFVGLKSKMYSIKSSREEKKRAKGISTRVVRTKLKHQDYVDCLQNQGTTYELQKRIGQQSHRLFTMEQKKKCLSPFDDKRFLLDDGVTSLAYGHYKIQRK